MSEAAQEIKEETQQTEVEVKALKMGWVPKEEFKGDPDKWRSAEEFVERGENYLPIVKQRLDKISRENEELRKTMREFADHHKKVSEREYKRAMADLQRQKDEAIELGDKDKVKAVEADMQELETVKPPKVEAKTDGVPADEQERIDAFIKDNPWWNKDREMTDYGMSQAQYLERHKPHLLGTPKFYEEISARVRKEFPEKFTNERRLQPGAVHGGGNEAAGGGKKGRRFFDLPEDAQAQCRDFVKQGLLTEKKYLEEYAWE